MATAGEVGPSAGGSLAATMTFDDVARLSDRDLAYLFSTADPQVTLLALTGAPPHFVERLLRQMSATEARQLRRRLQSVGPLLLRDVELAQQRLAQIAAELAVRGLIQPAERRGFAAAA
jgi:flagellar motor switch protein FliG